MESRVYFYQAFNMTIASQISLPELQPCPGLKIPDVQITIGQVTKDIGGTYGNNRYYQGEKDRLILHIKHVGNYDIKNGKEIVIEPVENGAIKELRLFLLGSAFGALLWQRGIIPMHGSAVQVREKCFIITGFQGAGKSTLAAAFAQNGYKILTDDIAAVVFDREGDPWVYPSYPQQKLGKDSLKSLRKHTAAFPQITGRIDKYAVSLEEDFCSFPKKLTAIYEVRKGNYETLDIFPLFGVEKLELIINNVCRYGFAEVMGLEERIFRQATALAQKVSVSRMIRPEHLLTVEGEKILVAQDFRNRGIV